MHFLFYGIMSTLLQTHTPKGVVFESDGMIEGRVVLG